MNSISSKNEIAVRTTYLSIIGNVVLAVIKGVTGYFGNSYALIADAIESTTDIFASVLVLFGLKYAAKPPDENHPYGHGKAEPLVTFLVFGFLLVSATVIFIESIHNIQRPHSIPEPYTLYVLGGIILFKEISYRFVNKRSQATNSTSLKADAWHHRSDAISSLMAFIGISIALYLGKGYESADDWAAMAGSVFIVYNAFLIFRPALGEIMDEHSHHDMIEFVRQQAMTVKGVRNTEKCFVRKNGMNYFVDLHIEVDQDISVKEGHDISHSVKDKIRFENPDIIDVLIHIEPSEDKKR